MARPRHDRIPLTREQIKNQIKNYGSKPVKKAYYVDATYHLKLKSGWYIICNERKELIYHSPKLHNGSLRLFEFLACVHAIHILSDKKLKYPIYTTLTQPIFWVNKKQATPWNIDMSDVVLSMAYSSEEYLKQKDFKTEIKFWPFIWGRIPSQKFLFSKLHHTID